MKSNIKHLAAVIATAIWADGVYDEAEKIVIEEIADAFELNEAEFKQAVEAALAEIENKSEEEVEEYILAHSAEIEDEEVVLVYEAVLQALLVDGVISKDEVNNLLSIASALGIDDEEAVLLLLDLVKEQPELEIEL